MRTKSLWKRSVFSGLTIGGSGGGQPLPLVVLTLVVVVMAVVTVIHQGMSGGSKINLDKEVPFKCTGCAEIVQYTLRELRDLETPMGPMAGPLTLECPKCKKKTLTQAVACPNLADVFIIKMDMAGGEFDDKCPKCGVSYAEAWQEKYRKEKKKKK